MEAAVLLEKEGIDAAVIKLTELARFSSAKVFDMIGETDDVFVFEECVSGGCVASKLAMEAAAAGNRNRIIPVNLGQAIIKPASVDELMRMYNLDAESIAGQVKRTVIESTYPEW